jgi:hypothetical protein
MPVCRVFHRIVTTVTLDHIVATVIFYIIVVPDTVVAFYSLGCPAHVIVRDVV